MEFDYGRADQLLRKSLTHARTRPLLPSDAWIRRIAAFCDESEEAAKTHIAMFSAAVLALAVDPRVDIYRINIGDAKRGSYSARRLVESVWYPIAQAAKIDLGAKRRNPLNNSPYNRSKSVRVIKPSELAPRARKPFQMMLELIEQLRKASTRERARALHAFVQLRMRAPEAAFTTKGLVTISALAKQIEKFVATKGEDGKRARAVAAGLLDAAYGKGRVRASDSVNDPDRSFPCDIALLERDKAIRAVVEVRHKRVTRMDLRSLVTKTAEVGIKRLCVLGVAKGQPALSSDDLGRFTGEIDIHLVVVNDWRSFIEQFAFHGQVATSELRGVMLDRIHERLLAASVSRAGINEWRDFALAID